MAVHNITPRFRVAPGEVASAADAELAPASPQGVVSAVAGSPLTPSTEAPSIGAAIPNASPVSTPPAAVVGTELAAAPVQVFVAPQPAGAWGHPTAVADDPGVAARRVVRGPGRTMVGLLLLWITLVAAGAEVAYLWSSAQPEVFAARTEIQYRGDAWVETEAEALRSEAFYGPIARAEGIDETEFLENVNAGQVPGTEVLSILYQSEDPETALRIVTAYADAYLATFEVASISDQEIAIQEELDPLEERLQEVIDLDLAASIRNPGPDATAQQVAWRAEAGQLRDRIGTLQQELIGAELARIDDQNNRPTTITEPFVLHEPVEPQPKKRAILGAMIGAVLASLVVFVIVWRVL